MKKLKEADSKSNRTLHTALCFGLLLVIAVMYYLVSSNKNAHYDYKSTYFILSAAILFISMAASSKVYTTNINKATDRTFDSYDIAAANFRAAVVARWSLVQGVSLITLVLAFLESNLLSFIIPIIGLLFIYSLKMNEEHFDYYKFN